MGTAGAEVPRRPSRKRTGQPGNEANMEQDDIGEIIRQLERSASYAADNRALCAVVFTSDLTAILREFAALRKAYEQRGEALQRIAGGAK